MNKHGFFAKNIISLLLENYLAYREKDFSMISLGELGPSDTAVIREVYDSDNASEIFEMELERALQVTLR